MASIADVAKEANVSVATVSRVLNNSGKVQTETVSRVLAAVKKLSYEPNLLARNFRKVETRVLLILTPNITNPYYAHIIAGISDVAQKEGYSVFLSNTNGEAAREQETLGMLSRRRADGAILLASVLDSEWLQQGANKFPVVQCSEFDPDMQISHVSINNYGAACDAMRHLISQGHRRIATVSSENNYYSTKLRLKAYYDMLAEAGLPFREEYVYKADKGYSFKSGVVAVKNLMMMEQRPTALFCISDTLAMGCVVGAQELGFQVPRDLSVTGFDDVENTTMIHPYITTVAQPCYELGRQGALMLLGLMRRQEIPLEVVFPHRMVIRESTAAIVGKHFFADSP
ncbi:MAG: LacI family DNA-binding transcriptional regulator [Oscillospiraceae bacterium]